MVTVPTAMSALDHHLQAVVRTGVQGVVAVAVRPGFSWEGAAGVSDVETGAPMTLEHRFRIASVTKLFVATVVLQLVGEGAFELDGEVGSTAGGVTVRQLLNHTSGLQNYADLGETIEPYRQDINHRSGLTPRDALALAEARPRLFAPGEGWSYSGSNYVALGLLVEETTGATLREELSRRIFEPLGLGSTDLPDDSTSPGLARGYIPPNDPLLPFPGPDLIDVTDLDMFTWGGGGMVSTARDVARFLGTLLGGELLSPDLRDELLSTVVSDWEESDGYGLGIEEVTSVMGMAGSPCGPAWGHLGFWPGYGTIALASKTGDRQVVILANTLLQSEEPWVALGDLTWACYCGGDAS